MESFSIDNIVFRDLKEEDLDNGYLELMSYLSSCEKNIDKDELVKRLKDINNTGMMEIIIGVYNKKIISNVTLLYEKKFIRNLGIVCHVEDFVIHPDYQKLKLGTKINELVKKKALENKCYKIILDCSEEVKSFYIKQGFIEKSVGMALYFNKNES